MEIMEKVTQIITFKDNFSRTMPKCKVKAGIVSFTEKFFKKSLRKFLEICKWSSFFFVFWVMSWTSPKEIKWEKKGNLKLQLVKLPLKVTIRAVATSDSHEKEMITSNIPRKTGLQLVYTRCPWKNLNRFKATSKNKITNQKRIFPNYAFNFFEL